MVEKLELGIQGISQQNPNQALISLRTVTPVVSRVVNILSPLQITSERCMVTNTSS